MAAILLLVCCSKKVDDDLINKKPTNFSLVEVPHKSTNVNVMPKLQWNSSIDPNDDEVTYTILLDTNENPIKEIEVGLEENRFVMTDPLAYETNYYWKVVATDDTGLSTESNEIFSFTTQKKSSSPGVFNLISVANEAVDVTLLPTFEWEPLVDPDGDAIRYELLIDTKEDPVTSVAESLEGTNYVVKAPLDEGVTYYWKVIATAANGSITQSDEVFSFTTLKDNNQPKPFTLIGVTDTAIGVDLFPEFSWNASQDEDGDALTYTLYLDQNEDPQAIFAEEIENESYKVIDDQRLELLNTYFWKVKVTDGNGGEALSDTYSFTTRGMKKAVLVTGNTVFDKRIRYTLTEFNDKLWMIGGVDLVTGPLSDIWSSDDGENWNQVVSNAPFGNRYDHATIVHNNKLWVIGGGNEVWSSSDGLTWTELTTNLPFAVNSDHKVIAYKNKIFIYRILDNDGFYFDAWSSENGTDWVQINTDISVPARTEFEFIEFNDSLWIIGGKNSSAIGSFNDVWKSADGASWSIVNNQADFSSRHGHITFSLDNRMWVLGGGGFASGYYDLWFSYDGIDWMNDEYDYDNGFYVNASNYNTVVFKNKLWLIRNATSSDSSSASEIYFRE
ncbi:hypothetical protein GCM10022393_29100 [Aquimarina addita]|uniref:Fibronectin type-III domain-containing protein n=1 Tax=Aquimarina addita TaxID=870485 RepID=A0ABP6UN65_9FLAO